MLTIIFHIALAAAIVVLALAPILVAGVLSFVAVISASIVFVSMYPNP